MIDIAAPGFAAMITIPWWAIGAVIVALALVAIWIVANGRRPRD